MNHFIYAMNSTDPAPATGGTTKSWFLHYKWDVDDFTYVPVAEELLIEYKPIDGERDTLWFVMDDVVIGCAPIHAVLPAFSGGMELHYDTRLIQATPDTVELRVHDTTGLAVDPQKYTELKRRFDAQYPPRNAELAASLG